MGRGLTLILLALCFQAKSETISRPASEWYSFFRPQILEISQGKISMLPDSVRDGIYEFYHKNGVLASRITVRSQSIFIKKEVKLRDGSSLYKLYPIHFEEWRYGEDEQFDPDSSKFCTYYSCDSNSFFLTIPNPFDWSNFQARLEENYSEDPDYGLEWNTTSTRLVGDYANGYTYMLTTSQHTMYGVSIDTSYDFIQFVDRSQMNGGDADVSDHIIYMQKSVWWQNSQKRPEIITQQYDDKKMETSFEFREPDDSCSTRYVRFNTRKKEFAVDTYVCGVHVCRDVFTQAEGANYRWGDRSKDHRDY